MPLVVKYGGNAMVDGVVRTAVAGTLARLADEGEGVVVVHGGGPFIQRELDRESLETKFVRGLRVTPPEAMAAVERALTLLGKRLSQEIGRAVGLSGRDSRLLVGQELDPELGRVGRISEVNTRLLLDLLRIHVTPVVACLAVDSSGEPLNVNADEVAGAVAGALRAPVLFLTNVVGVLADPTDPASRIARLTRSEAGELISDGTISGGMIPKVEAALAALAAGASSAVIADGTRAEGLKDVLDGHSGTTIAPD